MTQNLFTLAIFFVLTAVGNGIQFGPGLWNIVAGVIVAVVVGVDLPWHRE